jgi:protein ImuB
MEKRFVSIWFRHLKTDWFSIRQPHLKNLPFVLRTPSHGRMIITAANAVAEIKGISCGMVLADARAIFPELEVQDDKPDLVDKLLTRLAEWCIRFTPMAAIDPPDGIVLDVSGCSHLWGGDTIGAAWGVARFGKETLVASGMHSEALMSLPPESLRMEAETVMRLHKLGLRQVRQFITMPRSSLRRRFGEHLLHQIDKAFGHEMELMQPVQPVEPYQKRLPCLEPIVTLTGIEMALQQLLETLCHRLQQEQKGLRSAVFKGYRVDGKIEQISIGTNRPSHHVKHLYRLLEGKLSTIEPAMGIELFVLEAQKVEDHFSEQTKVWEGCGGLEYIRVSELLDRLATKAGMQSIHRYAPDEHYWPERSYKKIALEEKLSIPWRADKPRPLQLLHKPESIEVTAPIPDYPPMLFRYKGKLHTIVKADGPERIEQEWWLQQGQHRDYYRVEDEEGNRYWLFRLGHYHDETYQWFIHGFFA